MPKIQNSIPGVWETGQTWLKTGDKVADLQSSLLEVNILQDIYKPYETIVCLVSNDAAIDSLLPIIIGTELFYSYTLNGIKIERFFRLTALEYITSSDKAKGLKLTGISKEYYDITLNVGSFCYKDAVPKDIMKKNGIKNLFNEDKVESRTWVIPQGYNKLDFINDSLGSLISLNKSTKARLIRSKEGYSICNFESFTESIKKNYEIPQNKSLTLYYKDEVLRKKINTGGGDIEPLQKLFAIESYDVLEARSYSKAIKHKEFSYVIDQFDPMRKKLLVQKYTQDQNTNYGSTLYLQEDIDKIPNRYYKTNSSSTEVGKDFRYEATQNVFALNRSGFSSQNSISVNMLSNPLCEIGLIYNIDIGADLMDHNIKDPILSGEKYCIRARHIFVPDQLARVVLTLASEGGVPSIEYYENSKLGKK